MNAQIIDLAAWKRDHRPVRVQVVLPVQAWIDVERSVAAFWAQWWQAVADSLTPRGD